MLTLYKPQKPRTCFGAFLIAVTSWMLTGTGAKASDWGVFTDFDSLTYSENFTIFGLLDGIDDSIFTPGGEASYTHNQWVVGVRKGPWELGLLTRYDYIAEYTADAALIAFANEAETEVPNGLYDINVRLNHSRSNGLRFGYTHSFSEELNVKLQISALAANEIIDGTLVGNIGFIDDEVNEGALAVDYRFTDDLLFLRAVDKPTGYGASLDLIVNWQATDELAFEFSAYDAASRIWWDDLPGTIADATTAISRTADNGVLIVRPTLQGRNLLESYQQTLRARLKLRGEYAIADRWHLSQDIFKTGRNYLAESGVRYEMSSNIYLGTNFEWVSGAVGLNFQWKNFELGFATDSLKWREARYAKAHIGVSHKF